MPADRRPHCHACGRPQAGCFCGCVHAVENLTHLLILQHPGEVPEAKGTAALLHHCLRHSTLLIGERFDAPPSSDGMVLLYPPTAAPSLRAPARWPVSPPHTLVVLDGTWRKSRRMLHENAWLQSLPRLTLNSPPASRYAIREAQAPEQRSTLEACALALAQLDGDEGCYRPLWDAMDAFIALQQHLATKQRTHAPDGPHLSE